MSLRERRGLSLGEIVQELTEPGATPPEGRRWQRSTVQRVLERAQPQLPLTPGEEARR